MESNKTIMQFIAISCEYAECIARRCSTYRSKNSPRNPLKIRLTKHRSICIFWIAYWPKCFSSLFLFSRYGCAYLRKRLLEIRPALPAIPCIYGQYNVIGLRRVQSDSHNKEKGGCIFFIMIVRSLIFFAIFVMDINSRKLCYLCIWVRHSRRTYL